MLSFQVDPESIIKLNKIISLSSEQALFLKGLDIACLEAMRRYAQVSNVGASTRIENAVLTDMEIDWMETILSQDHHAESFLKYKDSIENKLSKDKERSIEEVAGLRDVLNIVYSEAKNLFPLRESTLCGLHRELLKYYPPASHYLGKYKITSNSVVERKGNVIVREVLKTADPGPMTTAAMHDLVTWYNETLPEHHYSLAVITEFIFRFLAIHPFQDGNGRMGRALFALAVLQSPDQKLSEVMPYLSVDRHIEKSRTEYYLALRRCSEGKFLQDPKEYQMNYFFNFMLSRFEESLKKDIPHHAQKYKNYIELSPSLQKVFAVFREYPEKRLKIKDVESLTQMPRSTLIYALTELFKKGFLQRTGRAAGTQYQLVF